MSGLGLARGRDGNGSGLGHRRSGFDVYLELGGGRSRGNRLRRVARAGMSSRAQPEQQRVQEQ